MLHTSHYSPLAMESCHARGMVSDQNDIDALWQVFDETDEEGAIVAHVRIVTRGIVIVPSKPLDDDKVTINKLEVNACFKEVETTVTTTPSGTTTTRSTTTQYTPTETTVTTVATTFTPVEPTGECGLCASSAPALIHCVLLAPSRSYHNRRTCTRYAPQDKNSL